MKNYSAVYQPRILPKKFPYFVETEIISVKKSYSQKEVILRLGVIFSAIALSIITLILWLYGFQLNYQMALVERQLADLRQTNDLEQVKVARLEGLDRLYQVATTQLGLVKPERIEYIYLSNQSFK